MCMERASKLLFLLLALLAASCSRQDVTFVSLLDEMVDYDEAARWPQMPFTSHLESSHDRRSVSPDSAGWFANSDGFGIIRVDTVDGRRENVLFDQDGPGVITRFWLTTMDKRGTMRFYFDHSNEAQWEIPAYDLMRCGLPVGKALLQEHPNYTPDAKGGNTLFLPIPYADGCKVTFELPDSVVPSPKYYNINYRKYPKGTSVETFSKELAMKYRERIAEVDSLLLARPVCGDGELLERVRTLQPGDSLAVRFPEGAKAVRLLEIEACMDSACYEQAMRGLVLKMVFDRVETVSVPLSDFSGAGMGARPVDSWYLSADGRGKVASRWVMPYQETALLKLLNLSAEVVNVAIKARVGEWAWDERSLYFHASWKQENGIRVEEQNRDDVDYVEWNFATLEGRGVYRGDVLTLFNHTPAWYGEGDEKIWVDGDRFPSHFGTGTEDYYNCSWAPVVPFDTPFGGAPRADAETATGYNTFFRTRNLDQMPFSEQLRFDIEMMSWISGTVDYATTVFWYGSPNARAIGCSPVEAALYVLPPQPEDPADYKISPAAVEFEALALAGKSPDLFVDVQGMQAFSGGKWSGGKQLLCTHGQPGDYLLYDFCGLEDRPYRLVLHATKAPDYGILHFYVDGQAVPVVFDGCSAPHYDVANSGPVVLGVFRPSEGKLLLRVELAGKNAAAHSAGNVFGLDCLVLE